MNSTTLWRSFGFAACVLAFILILTGCAQVDIYRAGAKSYGAAVADRALEDGIWATCKASTSGAVERRYGPDKSRWRNFCWPE